MSAEDHNIFQSVEKLLAANLAMQAQIEVLRDLVFVVAEQLGTSSVDGLSLPAWFQREKLARLEHI